MRATWARRLGIVLGTLFWTVGVAETLSHLDGGWPFWAGSLVGGGTLVLAGALHRWPSPLIPLALVSAGAMLGANATTWTGVLPAFAMLVVLLFVLDAGDRIDAP